MNAILLFLVCAALFVVLRWGVGHWRRQVLPGYVVPEDRELDARMPRGTVGGLARAKALSPERREGERRALETSGHPEQGGTFRRQYPDRRRPLDQASGLRAAMADLEGQKRAVGYYDRLCSFCNGKLAEGERIHPGCEQAYQAERKSLRE